MISGTQEPLLFKTVMSLLCNWACGTACSANFIALEHSSPDNHCEYSRETQNNLDRWDQAI